MITRENYEEFFILYIDDELPVTVRAAVEKFVAENPDLKEEWEALLQCRLQPDHDHGFRDKDSLFHYESSLLSYVDGELDEREGKELEELVRLQPRAAETLRLLQMTVSHPDPSIVFPGKESLYRGHRRRAVLLPWLRAGIAAAMLGGVALLLFPRTHPGGTIASSTKIIPPAVTPRTPATLYPTKKDDRTRAMADVHAQAMTTVNDNGARRTNASGVEQAQLRRKARPFTPAPVVNARPPAMLNTQVQTVDTSGRSVKTEVAAADAQSVGDQKTMATAVAAVYIPREQSSFATQALLQQQMEDDSTTNNIADISTAPAKNKLRGIFRKVGRAFGKTADRDDDGQRQVLISAFQVALK